MAFRATILGALVMLVSAGPVLADWSNWRPAPSDAKLEEIVRTAYVAAANYARGNTNYFARNDDLDGLEVAIGDELGRQGFASVEVTGAADLRAARACAGSGVQLRFAVTLFGDGISLAAASPKRVFSYHYDPHEDAAIAVAPVGAC
jgi:hypothetical protein